MSIPDDLRTMSDDALKRAVAELEPGVTERADFPTTLARLHAEQVRRNGSAFLLAAAELDESILELVAAGAYMDPPTVEGQVAAAELARRREQAQHEHEVGQAMHERRERELALAELAKQNQRDWAEREAAKWQGEPRREDPHELTPEEVEAATVDRAEEVEAKGLELLHDRLHGHGPDMDDVPNYVYTHELAAAVAAATAALERRARRLEPVQVLNTHHVGQHEAEPAGGPHGAAYGAALGWEATDLRLIAGPLRSAAGKLELVMGPGPVVGDHPGELALAEARDDLHRLADALGATAQRLELLEGDVRLGDEPRGRDHTSGMPEGLE